MLMDPFQDTSRLPIPWTWKSINVNKSTYQNSLPMTQKVSPNKRRMRNGHSFAGTMMSCIEINVSRLSYFMAPCVHCGPHINELLLLILRLERDSVFKVLRKYVLPRWAHLTIKCRHMKYTQYFNTWYTDQCLLYWEANSSFTEVEDALLPTCLSN